ncbi:MAG: hypothetical protein ACKVS6_01085 [Planctomycetota bacterium]
MLKESIHRAGIDISEKAVELFSRVLREAARLKLKSNDEINELIQKVGSLERSNHETAIVMHREMAWAHTLNEKLANSEQLLEAERQRLTTEIERTQSQLSAEKDRLEREIGEVVHQLEVAKQRVEILEKGQQGSEFKEIIIRDIERRWREAEDRRETAIRELGSAVERVRGLEEARTSFEARMRDEQLKFERIDKELQELRDKSSRIELDNRQLHLTVERDSAEKNELIKRIKNAEDAFDAASKSLRNYELDIEKLRLQMAEAESRRESSERLLVETQISLEGSKRALNELTSELGQERRKRSDEVLKTVKEVEKATQLIAQLEDQVSALSERILSAESYAADLQVKLTHETSRADASEAREEALRISLSQSREAIAGYEKQVAVLQRERESLRESIQRYQENVNELESSLELLRSDLARIESIVKDLQAERLQLLDTIQSNEKAIADLKVQISVRETEFLDRMDEFRKERTSYQSKIEKLQLELNTERERHAIERAAHEASREKIRILEAARSALSAEAAALKNANAALHTEIGELQSTGRQLRERIEELIVERNELQQLLTTERGYAHLLHLQKSKVEQDLASTRAQLEATLFTLDAAYRDLDASRSVHAERVLDLARLRSSTKLDRDMLILQIVNLLSEVKRARLWGRKWTVAEREFLAGPGAGFVNEPLR